MCGICGFNWEDKVLVKKMADSLVHRGPDDSGYYVDSKVSLGHRRLSIIDLSKKGKNPVHNEEGTIQVVFNGEIYNYKEIKDELELKGHRFYSNTDTEVIVHAYEEYGPTCVKKFNGMFSFALYDTKHNRIFIARDRLGIKPLFYYYKDKKFIFASELKAILQYPMFKREIDYNSFNHYFAFFHVPAPLTIFKDVKKLLPGHYLILDKNGLKITQYWDLNFSSDYKDEQYYISKIKNLLDSSVKKRLMSDVPIGAFLSGGLDSSAIVATMSKLSNSPVKTFSIGFLGAEGFSELKYAREVAEHFNTHHHEFEVSPDTIHILPKIVWQCDEPYSDHSALPVYFVSELARRHVTVTLSGDGGDELFGGYERYFRQKLAQKLSFIPEFIGKGVFAKAGSLLPGIRGYRASKFFDYVYMNPDERYSNWFTIFDKEMKEEFYSDKLKSKISSLDSSMIYTDQMNKCNSKHIMNKISYADFKVYIPNDILVKLDKMSMLHSLEARVPLLDHEFVEFSATIPPWFKVHKHVKKYLFKKAMKDVLPKNIIYRKKKGFGIPLGPWFRNELKSYAYDTLLSNEAINRGYFNKYYVQKILDNHQLGRRNYGSHIWSMLCFEIWNKIYIDNEKIPKTSKEVKV